MNDVAIGIDVGGTNIKGAGVDVARGTLLTTRLSVPTPNGATPQDVSVCIAELAAKLRAQLPVAAEPVPVGVALPGVVRGGVMLTAANVDRSWVGRDAEALFSHTLHTSCRVLNDADAAGVAEAQFGSLRGVSGMALLLTFGTGIGSACLMNGMLVPGFELGHLQLNGHADIERHASTVSMQREGLSIAQWADRVRGYLNYLELIFSPEMFVLGGSISKNANEFLPFAGVRTPVLAAHFFNDAGIIGAAVEASQS